MGQEEVMEEALGLGANYVLLKPFDSNALVKKIRQIKNGKIAANRKDFITTGRKNRREGWGLPSGNYCDKYHSRNWCTCSH